MKLSKQLKISNYIGFGLGDFAFNLFFQGATLFLLFFYTDILGIEAAIAGSIFLVATVWDAISDPLMGYLAGRFHSRWGRYRPFLLIAAIPLGLSYLFLFYDPGLSGSSLIIWVAGLQILFRTFFTMGNIPYSSLSSEMTIDSYERSRLAAYRMFLGYAGALSVSYFTGALMGRMGWTATNNGYFYVGMVFSVVAAMLFAITFWTTFELPNAAQSKKITFSNIGRMLRQNSPFLRLCAFVLFGMAGVVMFYQSLTYYFKYNLNRESALGTGMLYLFLTLMITLPLWLWLNGKVGKRNTLLMGCFLTVLASFTFFINPLIPRLEWVFLHMALIGSGIGCMGFSFWAMLPDTVEYGEWKSGVRREAVLFGLGLFFLKMGLGIGSFILGLVLQWLGYVPNSAQTMMTIDGIHSVTTLVMGFAAMAIILLMVRYPLTTELHGKIVDELANSDVQQSLSRFR